ncbi:MAG: hypothetical protein AB1640_10520 [bacterium]
MRYGSATVRILTLLAAVSLLAACPITGGSFGIHWGNETAEVHPPVVDGSEGKGPPPHAPAHGYRAKHSYRYYPSCAVYYEPERQVYFYLSGDNWQISASLPGDLEVQLGSYVSMDLDTDRPYVYYEEHKNKYPPGQKKEKKHKKEKRDE